MYRLPPASHKTAHQSIRRRWSESEECIDISSSSSNDHLASDSSASDSSASTSSSSSDSESDEEDCLPGAWKMRSLLRMTKGTMIQLLALMTLILIVTKTLSKKIRVVLRLAELYRRLRYHTTLYYRMLRMIIISTSTSIIWYLVMLHFISLPWENHITSPTLSVQRHTYVVIPLTLRLSRSRARMYLRNGLIQYLQLNDSPRFGCQTWSYCVDVCVVMMRYWSKIKKHIWNTQKESVHDASMAMDISANDTHLTTNNNSTYPTEMFALHPCLR